MHTKLQSTHTQDTGSVHCTCYATSEMQNTTESFNARYRGHNIVYMYTYMYYNSPLKLKFM